MALTFSLARRVEFAETDMAGVMHFSNYFRWMEEVEHEMFRSLGLCVVQPEGERTLSWPRIHVACEYRGPLRFEDVVDVRLTVTKIGGKAISYEAVFEGDGKEKARGQVTMVCCEIRDGHFQAIRIPDDIRRRFEGGADGEGWASLAD